MRRGDHIRQEVAIQRYNHHAEVFVTVFGQTLGLDSDGTEELIRIPTVMNTLQRSRC